MAEVVHDGNKLSVVFGGVQITGFTKDTSLRIESDGDLYTKTEDLHGNVIRSKINNSCAKVTITLVKSSKSNKVLSKYLQLDQLNNSGAFSIAIKDACSNDLFASDSGYITRIPNMSITKTPNIEYGEEVKTVEWEIMATQVVQNIGYIF